MGLFYFKTLTNTTPGRAVNPGRKRKMFIMYYKELCIVKEPMTKNRTCQTWRGKQIAMCEEEAPLLDYIRQQKEPEKYYIEKQPERK